MTDDRSERTTEILADPTLWADTPDVLSRVLADTAEPTRADRRQIWIPAAVAVAGLALALLAFLSDREPPADFLLAGTDLAPQASAEVRVIETPAGIVLRLEVEGLDPAPSGMYYQGWVVSDEGAVSVGTFHMRGGDGSVAFWSGVEPERYPTLIVTLQDEAGGPARSETVVLTGQA
ncbi:MAG: anti-sigma factor [Acidimicrobiia bacterium]|nr:anti-sigma factor [Acidimicrobiia bacterium]